MDPIYHINYNFDTELLLKEYFNLQKQEKTIDYKYYDSKNNFNDQKTPILTVLGNPNYVSSYDNLYLNEAKKFCDYYNIEDQISVKYLVIKANTTLGWHVDDLTVCKSCINHILSDDIAPISFENGDYFYKSALIDISKKHSVKNNTHDRIIFRISFKNLTFSDIVDILKKY